MEEQNPRPGARPPSAAAFALGVLSGRTGFLVLGAVFLGEEIYETALLSAIIRSGETNG